MVSEDSKDRSKPGGFSRRVLLPLALLVLATVILVVVFALFSAAKQDREALTASTRLAQTALATKEREIERNLKDYAFWQDAFDNLHVKLNLAWAATDGNVGANIYNSLGYDMAFVLSPKKKTVYALVNGKPVIADALSQLPGLLSMIPEAQQGGAAAVRMMHSGRGVVITAAAAILPPDEASAPAPDERSVMVFVKQLDAKFLSQIGANYLLADLKMSDTVPPDAAALPLLGAGGQALGNLVWTPERPGQDVLQTILPSLAGVLACLLAFAGLVLRDARRSALRLEESAHTIQAYAQTLEDSEARFRDVAEASSDWIWETDAELKLTYLSARSEEVTGLASADMLGHNLQDFFFSDPTTNGWSDLRGQIDRQEMFRDLRCCYRDRSGDLRTCRIAGRPIVGAGRAFAGYRGTATDVTAEVEAQERANHLALHDALTGLPNRVLLRERLNVALESVRREKARVAVLCLDLDQFKEVNDTLGHGAGDVLLQQLAERLQRRVRGMDTVARLGGDEFALVQVGCDQPAAAEVLARRLLADMKEPFIVEGSELFVGISIGIALSPDDGTTQEALLKSADLALYRAKQAGRGTFRFFEAAMDSELQARKALEQDLRRAIIREELQLVYQPLVSVEEHALKGVEALIRWAHPKRGLISPTDFIPLAEETGLIVPIGEWVLRTACSQAIQWPGLLVAVNVSAVQFKHREFVETVRQVLRETGLEPGRLELEITEGVLLYDTAASLEILTALKELGVRIAMDDFGTGYSSLGYLNSFPFDKIKIDRSFISEVAEKEKSSAIVRSVIGLGQSLSMVTTAEGVETLAQLDFLRDEGCDQVQGYFFGRPVPPQDLTIILEGWDRTLPMDRDEPIHHHTALTVAALDSAA